MSSEIFGIYNAFGNLFALKYTGNNLFKLEEIPEDLLPSEKIIHFEGNFYSYEQLQNSIPITPDLPILKSMFTKQFAKKLKDNNYNFKGKYLTYKSEQETTHPHPDIFKLFDGFRFRVFILNNQLFLCLDPHLVFEVISSIADFIEKGIKIEDLHDFSVVYQSIEQEFKINGYLLETIHNQKKENEVNFICKIKNYRDFEVKEIPSNFVYPESRPELIQKLLKQLNKDFNVIKLQREKSFLYFKSASRDRFSKTLERVSNLVKDKIFPVEFGDFKIDIETNPIIVRI